MNLTNSTAQLLVPDGQALDQALSRITHLGIGAHQDDLEFMAFHGIVTCYRSNTGSFGGVTCTDGSGSARAGEFAGYSDAEMQAIRRDEQNEAARIGRYRIMIQLDHPSAEVRKAKSAALRDDLLEVIRATRPRIVYTHNLADKHATHIGVAVAVIEALRMLPPTQRPEAVHGCEVWRSLDWLPDEEKIVHDVSGYDELAAALTRVFRSQIAGGKRYDLAVVGRRRANATFLDSHTVDQAESIAFAMDLTPLVRDSSLDLAEYVNSMTERFRNAVSQTLRVRLDPPS